MPGIGSPFLQPWGALETQGANIKRNAENRTSSDRMPENPGQETLLFAIKSEAISSPAVWDRISLFKGPDWSDRETINNPWLWVLETSFLAVRSVASNSKLLSQVVTINLFRVFLYSPRL
jgi:hypothetical protein